MTMVQTTKGSNARIAGEGQLSGGSYGDITINGAGSIKGDVTAKTVRINGAGTTDGSMKADAIVVNGSASFGHELQASEMTVNGDASVAGGVGVGRLKVKGRFFGGGGLAAHEVDAKGEFTITGDASADTFFAEGAFSIGGLLNAETIDIKLHAPSKVRDIGGEKVYVKQARGLASVFTFFAEKRLTVDSIEADDVVVEFVTAKVVRGARIDVGEGCNVELVEYTDDFKQHAGAIVGSAVKVVAPQ
jgi:cytoskeletal protein CcmA (bactofilin family)